ncbi:serine/threonine dehydratase [Variovorax paradoxus]|uniref:serine/threonine dehydratase n=1 Tax=Variovorax paradoxus TaxID=34073 RepID=UPI001933E6F6|nr:serine/threonine dehydratase [Variovorax paradoxus]
MSALSIGWKKRISEAHSQIEKFILCTPCIDLPLGFLGSPYRLTLKLEHLQYTGSFKPRGVFNRLSGAEIPPAGLICASGGNHGAALAYAARTLRVPCEVFVPKVTSQFKRDRLLSYGARVIEEGDVFVEALQASERRREQTGAMSIHAFDHVQTLAGQGTIAKEIEEQIGVPDAVVLAVGGGGLLGGISGWFGRDTAVVGAEPELCATFNAAMAAGRPVTVSTGGIAADALGCRELGLEPYRVVSESAATSLLVSEAAILDAQRSLWEELRMVVEPAAAVPLAAVRSGRLGLTPGAHVCLIICGANVAPSSVAG